MIEKNLFHIWIGDMSKAPHKWMKTWKDKHKDWNYTLIDNGFFQSYDWKNRELIDSYLAEKRYPAVADIIRYQILYDFGGFIAPADSICLENIDELMTDEAIGVYENEVVRPGLISPLYASKKGGQFAYELMTNLPKEAPKAQDGRNKAPWQVTGNAYMRKMYEKTQAKVTILPSHTFTPIHYTGERYSGTGKVYAIQMWGTTAEWTKKPVDYYKLWNEGKNENKERVL